MPQKAMVNGDRSVFRYLKNVRYQPEENGVIMEDGNIHIDVYGMKVHLVLFSHSKFKDLIGQTC